MKLKALKFILILSMFSFSAKEANAAYASICSQLFNLHNPSEMQLTDAQQKSLYNLLLMRDSRTAKESFDDYHRTKLNAEGISRLLAISARLKKINPQYAQTYYRALQGRRTLTQNEELILLAQHNDSVWRTLKNPKALAELRDRALDKELDLRGAPRYAGLRGRARLERLSLENLNRIMKAHNLSFDYQQNPKLLEAVNSIQFSVTRNTHGTDLFLDGVLSSRQLEKLTGTGGMNSQERFNKEFMKNDDNVYFHFFFNKNAQTQKTSEYGDHGHSVHTNFLRENAWISSYIMFPWQLTETGQRMNEIDPSLPREEILKQLHKTDFTYDHMTALVRAKAAQMILKDSAAIQAQVEKMYPGSKSDYLSLHPILSADFSESVLKELHMGSSQQMELKIPVYVPKDSINERW